MVICFVRILKALGILSPYSCQFKIKRIVFYFPTRAISRRPESGTVVILNQMRELKFHTMSVYNPAGLWKVELFNRF